MLYLPLCNILVAFLFYIETKEEPTFALHTISAGESIDAEVIESNRVKKNIVKKPKVIKF